MNIRIAILSLATALAMCYGSSHAADENADDRQLTDVTKSFLDAAAASDQSEIELSKVAAAKSQTPAVRDFAQKMIDDHSDNYHDLQALCDKKNYVVAPKLDSGHQEILLKLQSTASGNAFDLVYANAMAADESEMVGLLERIANNSNDSDITQFASDALTEVPFVFRLPTGRAHAASVC